MQFQTELCQALTECREETLSFRPAFETYHKIVGIADDNHLAHSHFLAPGFYPQIENVVQVHVGEQRRNYCPLWRSYLRFRPLPVFGYARLEPFLYQTEYPAIGHAVLYELYGPFVRQIVEKSANVRIEHPVHSLGLDPHGQRVQRLVRIATRSEPVRKAFEVHLVNLIENGHHGLLNNLVLQSRDAQRTLPPIGLRDIDSSRGLRLIRSTMYSAV